MSNKPFSHSLVAYVATSFLLTASLAVAEPFSPPAYDSLERAVSESNGYWIWTADNRAVKNTQTDIICASAYGDFNVIALSEREPTGLAEAFCFYSNATSHELLTVSTELVSGPLEAHRCDGSPRFTALYETLAVCIRSGDQLFKATIGTDAEPTDADAAFLVGVVQAIHEP